MRFPQKKIHWNKGYHCNGHSRSSFISFCEFDLYLTKSKKSILEGLGIIFIQGVIDGLTHITINDVISRVINSFGNNEIDSLIESRKGIRSLLNKSGNL